MAVIVPSGWGNYKVVTISAATVDEALTDFPLLLAADDDTGIGAHARADGHDLRVRGEDSEVDLAYEREQWDVSGGATTLRVWCSVPSISAIVDTVVYSIYGKSDASDGQSASSVWDSNFKGVWHAKEATGVNWADSTSNANTGTNNGVTATTGKVDGAGSFDGGYDYVQTSNSLLVNTADPEQGTVSAWVQLRGYNSYSHIFTKGVYYFDVNVGSAGYIAIYVDPVGTYTSTAIIPSNNTWHHLSVTWNADGSIIYLDGGVAGTSAVTHDDMTAAGNSGNVYIGGLLNYSGYTINGTLDEPRISAIARSAAWIKFEYANMGNAGNETTWGSEQSAGVPFYPWIHRRRRRAA